LAEDVAGPTSGRASGRASASLARGAFGGSLRAGFTLLEVIVAIAILAVSLLVLVDSQATAVLMTNDTTRILTGTSLAQEKLSEAMLRLEREGFQEGDIEEEGDFEDYGNDGALGEDVEFGDTFAGYRWAYTVRKVDLAIGDMSGAAEQLQQAGFGGSAAAEGQGSGGQEKRDLGDLGIDGSMFGDMLRNYIREVRVVVWWGEEELDLATCEECVELVTHAVNPSGKIIPAGGGQ
jgi:prepilin-type N-terminal cleavage/methylation domain-containing protein